MGIQLTALLHCHQPYRDLFDTTYLPLTIRYNGKIQDRTLIPNLYTKPEEKFVDHNKKITGECYRPLAEREVFSRLPFNISPSLLNDLWIRERRVHDKIVDSEKRSFDRFGGHSNAIAQASSNHVIMPLAKDKDKRLYLLWSIEEYEKHYGRPPKSMWLPETAVDKKTLSLLADLGIEYVVLAPRQAKSVKPVLSGNSHWQNVEGGRVDTSKPYKVYFEDTKKEIAVFFYDKEFSGSIGFSNEHHDWIYTNHENFINRWLGVGGDFKHFGVDGETFGHHKPGKANLLANALDSIERNPNLKLTNYGLFLKQNPPTWDVEVIENSSWSCEHGLVRWGREFTNKENNCHEGTLGSEWRVEMRRAFDRLAVDLDEIFLRYADKYYKDPVEALKNYGSVVSSDQTFYEFFDAHGKKGLSNKQTEEAYMLMEMQKFKLFMFTSCGWFHDYVKRPEPLTNFLFANSAIQIAMYFEKRSKLEERFLQKPVGEKLCKEPDRYYEQAKIDMRQVYKDAQKTMETFQRETIGNLA